MQPGLHGGAARSRGWLVLLSLLRPITAHRPQRLEFRLSLGFSPDGGTATDRIF